MTVRRVRDWVDGRSPIEWLAIAGALAVFGVLGWDFALWDPRLQLLLHAVGVAAIGGAAVAAWRGRLAVPSTPLDVPVLALVAAFALATVSAENVGLSLRALASIVGFALVLPLALVAVRHRPSWLGVAVAVPVLAGSIPSLAVLGWRRIEWILAGGPGLPPLRLPAEGTPFGSVAVPPFFIWPAWALAGLIDDPAWRRGIRTALVAVGVPLTILSGSRSAWLAMVVAALVAGVPWAWERRHRLRDRIRPTPAGIATAAVALIVTAGVAIVVVPRLAAVTSVLYRVGLWRDTLAAWQTDPWLGIGPGFMPIARQTAAADFTFPVRQPHSHNLLLGILGDAGLVGLAAGIVLLVVLARVAGPWRARTATGRRAAVVLLGLGVAGLFEDLTFQPNFNLVAIALVAVVLTDAGAVGWHRLHPRGIRRPLGAGLGLAAAAVLAAAMVVADAGAVAYGLGVDAAAAGRAAEARAWLARSVAIDPWHPSGPKALAVAAATAGDAVGAREAAQRAVELNPGDGHSWTNLALSCRAGGDADCATTAAERAAARMAFGEPDAYNAALVLDTLGAADAADAAYAWSLAGNRLTAFADPWPRPVSVDASELGVDVEALVDLNLLLAAWGSGDPVDPGAYDEPAVRALAHGMRRERPEALEAIDEAIRTSPEALLTWEIAVVLHEHWSTGEADRLRRIGEVVRGGPFPDRERAGVVPRTSADLATFRRTLADELVPAAVRLSTDPPFPWVLERTLEP